MTTGSINARFIRTGVPLHVEWIDGRITSIRPGEETSETEHRWIAPALVDLQINGYAGVDFQSDNLDGDQLLTAVRALRRDGCTRILFTLITDDWPVMMSRLQRAKRLVEANSELGAAVAGWHLEGPFLSSQPGFCGAHDPDKMIDPAPQHVADVRAVAGNDPVLLTVAPERPGAIEFIKAAVAAGFKVSLGHTDASADQLAQAVRAGATGFTHLGNGCPQSLDRHDNILWRVINADGLAVSLIPDTHHVSPPLFRLIHRVLKPFQIMHTTDAMAAAGATAESRTGRSFTLGRLQVEVGHDGIVQQPGRTNFAGSSLTPVEGVFRAAAMTGKPWQEMWLNSSIRPAEFTGWTSELKAGQPADFCVIEVDANDQLVNLETVNGRSADK